MSQSTVLLLHLNILPLFHICLHVAKETNKNDKQLQYIVYKKNIYMYLSLQLIMTYFLPDPHLATNSNQ